MENSGTVTIQLQEWGRLSRNLVLDPAPSSKYQVITVIDQGCGIRAETLARIFEPFFTTKSFSSRRGTGLGLSMVYELAKGMRYGLGVSSELGIGSRFSLWLPVDSVEEVDSKKLGKTQPTEGT
jgi:signal transduction histidine kinase